MAMNLKSSILVFAISLIFLSFNQQNHAQVPEACRQIIVTQTPKWGSMTGQMQVFQRPSARHPWQRSWESAVPVLLGRNGLAWGRGVFTAPENGVPAKVEKDGKAPAGIFQLGQLFGYADEAPGAARWPYVQVTPYDAWVDDVRSPYYNQHVRVKPNAIPPWFEKQRMRLGDAAYKWMIVIQHNTQPPVSGYGSAIFFHVRRGPKTPTAGCTSMAEENLVRLIRWLDPQASPHYVLLPSGDYQALRAAWRLP
jgi:L,D-peptidoglycan transpeptidase YkuD (ErfK/YbiS/YcfS/YnhG family)